MGGRCDLKRLEREDYRRALKLLQSVPANAGKLPETRELTLRQASDVALNEGLPLLAPKSVKDYWNKARQMLTWAVQNGKMERHFADGFQIDDHDIDDSELRDPFSIEELRAIFGPEHYPLTMPRGARYWVPLLALFHGFRLGEAAQLATADVVKMNGRELRPWSSNGVPCLSLMSGEIGPGLPLKKLKNKTSRRIVPVHPSVLELGFLNHVDAMRSAGELRLFTDLQPSRGSYSPRLSRWFARHLERCGVKSDKLTFHSFRHTWRDATRNAGLERELVAAMGGWSPGGTRGRDPMDNYGKGADAETLLEALGKVAFPGLDLTHLHGPEQACAA